MTGEAEEASERERRRRKLPARHSNRQEFRSVTAPPHSDPLRRWKVLQRPAGTSQGRSAGDARKKGGERETLESTAKTAVQSVSTGLCLESSKR